MKFPRGKTLIQVLSVGLVVLISVALLVPILFERYFAEHFRRVLCENDVREIEVGVNSFISEYGYLPGANGVVGGDLLATLCGSNTTLNPRKLEFLQVRRAGEKRSGVSGGVYVDCWGGAYQIAMASGTNRSVVAGTNGQMVWKKVAVWNDPSLGRDGATLTEEQRARRYVYSWK